jgi:hypothetical protein
VYRKIVAIAHNAKALDLLFVQNRKVRMKLLPKVLSMKGHKIMYVKVRKCHVIEQSELPGHATHKVARGIRSDG